MPDHPAAASTPPLDRERIIAATIEAARSPDRNSISFRKLGAQLDVDPTAIYRYFHNKMELVDAVPPDLPWRARLESIATATAITLIDHPAIGVHAGARSTNGPGEAAGAEMTIQCLEDAGLHGADVAQFWGLLTMLTLNFASAQAEVVLWMSERRANHPPPALTPALDPQAHPALLRHVDEITALDWTQTVELASTLVLDAIEARG